jgi:alkylation response protein AidB-like acyl-CoA dehydrogenase
MATPPSTSSLPPGGGFLLAAAGAERVFTPEDFTAEQIDFYRAAHKFAMDRVYAAADRIEKKDFPTIRALLREAGELGYLSLDIPEAFGGLAQDETTNVIVAEAMTVMGAWSVIFGAQVGIGSLPIVYFGTEEQKRKYLPRIASGEWAAAYALSEPSSASDSLAARTRAVLSPDGKHWILNGTKQWISNAGSSTCPLVFEDARVPKENLLGEIGKGHRIAFNILNIGRLKLGVTCVAGARNVIGLTVPYAKERKAFGRPIADFGLIRDKIARMVAQVYVGEAMSYRTTGLIDRRIAASSAERGTPRFDSDVIAAVEEYNIEASILKVWGSEALFQAADEGVQVHGGYGFVEEYPIERVFRDNRVNRIFEGTNEINRLLVPGTLLKRAMKGQFPMLELAQTVSQALERDELPRPGSGPLARERRVAELNKYLMAYATRVAVESFGPELNERQEVLGALADIAIEAFAVDSAVARALQAKERSPVAEACVKLYTEEAHERAFSRARRAVLCSVKEPAAARKHLALLQRLRDEEPGDPTAWREIVATAAVEKGGYPLSWA